MNQQTGVNTRTRKTPRDNLEKAIVTFDTSIIFSRDPKFVVCKDMEDFMEFASEKAELKLRVPDLVVKEIIQQRETISVGLAEELQSKHKSINECSGASFKTNLDIGKLHSSTNDKVRQWFRSHRIAVVPTPYKQIDLKDLEVRALIGVYVFRQSGHLVLKSKTQFVLWQLSFCSFFF